MYYNENKDGIYSFIFMNDKMLLNKTYLYI